LAPGRRSLSALGGGLLRPAQARGKYQQCKCEMEMSQGTPPLVPLGKRSVSLQWIKLRGINGQIGPGAGGILQRK
jgi:hypothetical protein